MNWAGPQSAFTARVAPVANEIAADDPTRDLKLGGAVAILFFILFLGWAALAPMDASVFAPGRLEVSGQRQSVQHRDGGIVSVIRVHEGSSVRAGEVLLELRGDEVRADERALRAQLLGLLTRQVRLEAEQIGAPTIRWPARFAEVDATSDELRAAIAAQSKEFAIRRSLIAAQASVLRQQAAQANQSSSGYDAQLRSSVEQERLVEEELQSLMPVAEKGFVSKSRIRALERAKAEIVGRRGQYSASVAESRLAAGAEQLRQLENEKSYRERASDELKDVSIALDEVAPKYRAIREQLRRLEIRAPVAGTVVGLNVFTPGGVVAAGQKLMDIVPQKASLVVSAHISPEDIDDVRVGQSAEIRFSGIHDRNLPRLSATLTRLSADVLTDEKTGASFYTAELVASPKELSKLRAVRGPDFQLRPGAPINVVIPVRKRTALDYAFEPIAGMLQRSGGEH